jgi:hypothetical protein
LAEVRKNWEERARQAKAVRIVRKIRKEEELFIP